MPTLELTDEQIKHVQLILKENKPSRTRLTRDEKNRIMLLLQHEIEAASYGIEINPYQELSAANIESNKDCYERIEIAERIIKKLK